MKPLPIPVASLPLKSPIHVEVEVGNAALCSRVAGYAGEHLVLTNPTHDGLAVHIPAGTAVRLVLHAPSGSWEASGEVTGRRFGQPPGITVGNLANWRPRQRRRSPRHARQLAVLLLGRLPADPWVAMAVTRDVSLHGLAVWLDEEPDLQPGHEVRAALYLQREAPPVGGDARVVRSQHLLAGRAVRRMVALEWISLAADARQRLEEVLGP